MRKKRHREIDPDEIFIDSANAGKFDRDQFEGRIERPLSRRSFIAAGVLAVVTPDLVCATGGETALALVRALPSPPEVIILTTFDADSHVYEALQSGAAGFDVAKGFASNGYGAHSPGGTFLTFLSGPPSTFNFWRSRSRTTREIPSSPMPTLPPNWCGRRTFLRRSCPLPPVSTGRPGKPPKTPFPLWNF